MIPESRRRRLSSGAGDAVLELTKQGEHAIAAGTAEEIDQALVKHGLERLAGIPRLRLIGPRSAEDRVPVFTFVLEGRSPMDVARALDEQGIAVRAGDMAAMPLLKRFGASEAIRASAYVLLHSAGHRPIG